MRADDPYEMVRDAICDHANDRGVKITHSRLMKHWEFGRYPTYTIQITVSYLHADIIMDDDSFWPENVNCRQWVPTNVWYNEESQKQQ